MHVSSWERIPTETSPVADGSRSRSRGHPGSGFFFLVRGNLGYKPLGRGWEMSGRHVLFSAFGLVMGLLTSQTALLWPGAPGGYSGFRSRVTSSSGLAPFVERSLEEARARGGRRRNPGYRDAGRPSGCRPANRQRHRGRPRFPVYAFVNRHAYSAGALIALATDRIYMRPGSVMGAATPSWGRGRRPPRRSCRPCEPR